MALLRHVTLYYIALRYNYTVHAYCIALRRINQRCTILHCAMACCLVSCSPYYHIALYSNPSIPKYSNSLQLQYVISFMPRLRSIAIYAFLYSRIASYATMSLLTPPYNIHRSKANLHNSMQHAFWHRYISLSRIWYVEEFDILIPLVYRTIFSSIANNRYQRVNYRRACSRS